MNPVSTLYHIAPCCFVFLFLPFTYIELPKIINDPTVKIDIPLLLGSAAIAFGEGGGEGPAGGDLEGISPGGNRTAMGHEPP